VIVKVTYTGIDCTTKVEQTIVKQFVLVSSNGAPGASAYQIALSNGFVGTEEEWLESLKSITTLVTSGFGENVAYDAETQTLTIDKYNFLDLARGYKFGTIPTQVSTTATGIIFEYEYITKNLFRYIANDLSEDAFYEELALTNKVCEKQITL
jgi:hypothetical protein